MCQWPGDDLEKTRRRPNGLAPSYPFAAEDGVREGAHMRAAPRRNGLLFRRLRSDLTAP